MKKTTKLLSLLIALVFVMSFVLAACTDNSSCEHVDANHDGTCDKCGEEYGELGNHIDADHDGTCDKCGETGLTVTHTGGTATCQEKATCSVCGEEYGELGNHIDANHDGVCDVCGEEGLSVVHIDSDGDGKCDVCGQESDAEENPTSIASIWVTSSKGYADEAYYTYVDYVSGTTNLNWNPHTWETNEDSAIMAMINVGWFDFVLNEEGTGYSIVPELATYVPGTSIEGEIFSGELYVDVTSLYAGQLGVAAEETSKAFRIYLNPNATFDDADQTAITAESYLYSFKEQLNPLMNNRRADSYYGGEFSIYGAESYLKQGSTTYEDCTAGEGIGQGSYTGWDPEKADGGLSAELKSSMYFVLESSYVGQWLYENYGNYVDEYGYAWTMVALGAKVSENEIKALKGKTLAEIVADETLSATLQSLLYEFWCTDTDEEFGFFCYQYVWESYDWDNVGIKIGKDEGSGLEYIDFIIENELGTPDFYVPYYLTSTPLVLESLYEQCKVYNYTDGTKTQGTQNTSKELASITSVYCTSLETSVGYGPYSFTTYELDKQLGYTRNESWYGYSDGMHEGQYQMDEYKVLVYAEHATALMAFESGLIDSIGLLAEDVEKYGGSSQLINTPSDYTTKLTINTDYDSLAARETDGINKTMLTVLEFRKAISLSFDREKFVSSYLSGATAGYGVINYLYVFDVENGTAYRQTDAAKQALVDLYGLEYGAGKDYATLDAAYQAITGYNPTLAASLFQAAYDYATTHDKKGNVVEAGSEDAIYNGTDTIQINFDVYNSEPIYVQMVNFFQEAITAAAKGTSLEGKIVLNLVVNADYYDSAATGATDIIFSTWGGATYNAAGLFSQCYFDGPHGEGNQMEYGFDASQYNLTIELDLDGTLEYESFTASLYDWGEWLNQKTATITGKNGTTLPTRSSLDIDTMVYIWSKVENMYLEQYVAIPVYYRGSNVLVSYKAHYAVAEYVSVIGFGGLRFMEFDYTDEQWTEFIKDSSNLDYTK